MKKFWNLMLAALVVLGAVACSENGDELTPQVEREGLSFEATIIMDDTRTSLEKDETSGKWNTVWSGDETLVVTDGANSYDFVYRADKGGKFSCNAEGVESLIGQPIEVRLKHSASTTIDSKAGMAGGSLYASVEAFDPATGVELITENSFFRFSSFTDVTLTASENIFVCDGVETNTITLAANNNAWVAFNPAGEVALSCKVNGVDFKSTTKAFEAKKVYNLGNMLGDKNANFSVVGGFNSWATDKGTALYLIPGTNTYVAPNVNLKAQSDQAAGFKIYGNVKLAEVGDLYLKPGTNWKKDGARFAAYFFIKNTSTTTWVNMTDTDNDGIYVVNIPTDKNYNMVIFCRMNPDATANNWNNKWNQSGDLTIPTNGNNLFTVANNSWDGATTTWSKHTPTPKNTECWFGVNNTSDKANAWYQRWSNNQGQNNITVTDYNKTYDIYFNTNDLNGVLEANFVVLEHGSKTPTLK